MKPIKDCQYAQDDGCCGYPQAPTPECHIDACSRLAWFVKALLARGERLCEVLSDDYGEDIPTNLILPVIELEAAIKASEKTEETEPVAFDDSIPVEGGRITLVPPSQMADAW